MELHRFIIKPLSPWSLALRADTLYGLLLWRIAEGYDAAKCGQYIDSFRSGNPPFILSSAFPEDMLPMPCLPPVPRSQLDALLNRIGFSGSNGEKLFTCLSALRKFGKLPWLPLASWVANAHRLSLAELFAWHCANSSIKNPAAGKTCFQSHVSIDRSSGRAARGCLFSEKLAWFGPDDILHIYARTDDPKWLLHLLGVVGELGFGKGASSGKGRFHAALDTGFNAAAMDSPMHCGARNPAYFLLSPAASPHMAAFSGWYRLESRSAKAGPGMGSPFKAPFMCIQQGAVLGKLPAGPYVLGNIHPNPAVAQITMPLTLSCDLIDGFSGEQS